MMPAQHYARAEELLEYAETDPDPERYFQDRNWLVARAQVHATLAAIPELVAVTAAHLERSDPAHPAKDEKDARCPFEIEGWGCSLNGGHDGDHIAYDQDGPSYVWPASSPVVPAPTETGPWKHRVNGEICVASPASGLPYTIGKFNDHGDFVWHSSAAELPEGFAPFVAAVEGK